MRRSNSSISEIDLRSVRDALILRWWIIPLVMLLSVGFLFANESDLQTSPAYVQVIRLYEARDESAVLTVAGIDPASIVPYPSFDNQLIVLQTPESRQKIAASINAETNVSVSRSEQKFSLLDTIEGSGTKRFTFLGVGSPSYTFGCAAPTADECEVALNAYVAEVSLLRAQSIQQGFERAEKLLNALIGNAQSENSSLKIKQQALATGKSLVTGEMALISTTSENVGPTVGTVNASTYGFGLGIGALLGLLVVLQLSVTDKRIRTRRKLTALVGEEYNLGTLHVNRQDSNLQHVAAGLLHQAALHESTTIRLLPIGDGNIDLTTAALTEALREHPIHVNSMKNVNHLTAVELLPLPQSVVVMVADAHTSRTDDLEEAWTIVEHAGNIIVGIILVQH